MARLVRELSPRGVASTVLALKGEGSIADRFGGDAEIICLRAGARPRGLAMAIRRVLARVRPDVIHARNWGAWPDVAAARLMLPRRPPLVWSFHGVSEPLPMPWRRRLACRLLAKATAEILTVSEASRRLLSEHVGLPAWRIGVIPNGVDADVFCPAPRPRVGQGTVVVGSVGSLLPIKNHALLLRACAGARAAGVSLRVRLAGDGPLRSELALLAEELRLSDVVDFCGTVRDVPDFLRGLDIFVLPSLTEQHPNALIEAMACGVACVGADVGGVAEALSGGAGVVCPSGDEAGFAAALVRLAREPALRQQLADAAVARARQQYSMQQMAERYLAVYTRAARRHPASSRRPAPYVGAGG